MKLGKSILLLLVGLMVGLLLWIPELLTFYQFSTLSNSYSIIWLIQRLGMNNGDWGLVTQCAVMLHYLVLGSYAQLHPFSTISVSYWYRTVITNVESVVVSYPIVIWVLGIPVVVGWQTAVSYIPHGYIFQYATMILNPITGSFDIVLLKFWGIPIFTFGLGYDVIFAIVCGLTSLIFLVFAIRKASVLSAFAFLSFVILGLVAVLVGSVFWVKAVALALLGVGVVVSAVRSRVWRELALGGVGLAVWSILTYLLFLYLNDVIVVGVTVF